MRHFIKFYYQILIILLFQIFTFAQSFEVKLIVADAENNTAVTNANISLSDRYFGTTNKDGESILNSVNKGIYTLVISHISYYTYEENFELLSDTVLTIKLFSGRVELQDVVVTSGKYEQNINMLPYSVSSIDKKEIEFSPLFTVSDLLKTESGISLLRDGIWGTEVSIRGLNRANVVTLIDGNRIETSTDISARLSMFDLNDVERIEVIKGAASSLYGSGATGGTINVISKSGSYTDKLKLIGSYSGGFNSVNNFFSNGINLIASGNEWILKLGS